MQSSHPPFLQLGVHSFRNAAANRVSDPITRQLMPGPPSSNLPFTKESTVKDGSAHVTPKNGNIHMELLDKNMSTGPNNAEVWDNLEKMASENAVVMFSISSCCVCHVVKRLFSSLGVAPAVYELDQETAGSEIATALQNLAGASQPLPAIFIGKKYLGGLEELIAAHIGGVLVPKLKQAGALWL